MSSRLWLAVKLAAILLVLAMAGLAAATGARGADRARNWCSAHRCEIAEGGRP